MKIIPLSNCETPAIVDDHNYDMLIGVSKTWTLDGAYAVAIINSSKGVTKLRMHELVLPPIPGLITDHKDKNTLNNLEANLEHVTHQLNCMNRGLRIDNTSGYPGVSWNTKAGKYAARVNDINKKRIHLGYFNSAEEAGEEVRKYNEHKKLTIKAGLVSSDTQNETPQPPPSL